MDTIRLTKMVLEYHMSDSKWFVDTICLTINVSWLQYISDPKWFLDTICLTKNGSWKPYKRSLLDLGNQMSDHEWFLKTIGKIINGSRRP